MNKQIVYVKPNANGFCKTFSYDDRYNNVDGWYQAFIDQAHLYGFGSMSYTVRYDFNKGILVYPDNWKQDQSQRLELLSNQIKSVNNNNSQLQDQIKESDNNNQSLKNQLVKSTENNNNLQIVVMNLQKQVSQIQATKITGKRG